MPPNSDIGKTYIRKNPQEAGLQSITEHGMTEVNTEALQFSTVGTKHVEGGWPREINYADEEQTLRYRRRIEREDKFDRTLKRVLPMTEHLITQNAAVNVVEEYFKDMASKCDRANITAIDSIRCFLPFHEHAVSANHINFALKSGDKIAVAYSNRKFASYGDAQPSCIWNLNFSQIPLQKFQTKSPLMQLIFSDKNDYLLAAGNSDGIVCLYDTRVGEETQMSSELETSHSQFVSSLWWISSKSNTELFSCSHDGTVMWWDIRNMTRPYEQFFLERSANNQQESSKRLGCSVLEYSLTMPSKFMIGTENGLIFNGNKRGVTFTERFPYTMKCFDGPVNSLMRNPTADKYFIAVGDHHWKIWTDECQEESILSSQEYNDYLTCGTWNMKRTPMFFIGRQSGKIEVWDILQDQSAPITTIHRSNATPNHICAHQDGSIFACCSNDGLVDIFRVTATASADRRRERASVAEIFDRETERLKYFLAKVREFSVINKENMAPEVNEDMKKDCEEDIDETVNKSSNEILEITEHEFNNCIAK